MQAQTRSWSRWPDAAWAATCGAVVIGCAPAPIVPRAPPPAHVAEPPSQPATARWVPRVAPAPHGRLSEGPAATGPLRNNLGTPATAYLGERRVGLLDRGRRLIVRDGVVSPVAEPPGDLGLTDVVPVPPGLGGGFLFAGRPGLYHAPTFDGALVRLAESGSLFLALAPHSVLVGPDPVFVRTSDGRPVPGAPGWVERVYSHRRGFAVATAQSSAWFTADGKAWVPLRAGAITQAVEDGDALLLFDGTIATGRVSSSGAVTPTTLSPEDSFAKRVAGAMAADRPERWGIEDGFEGSLLDAGWAAVGPGDARWYGVRDGVVWVVDTRTHTVTPVGGKVAEDDEVCAAVRAPDGPLVACYVMGTRLRTLRLDAASPRVALERTLAVSGGFATQVGTESGAYPSALFLSATCDGEAQKGLCVRDGLGRWATFPAPVEGGQTLLFPGEVITLRSGPDGGLEVRSEAGRDHRRFSGSEMTEANRLLSPRPDTKGGMPALVNAGALRRPTGIRLFLGPNPLTPIVDPVSVRVDLPFDPGLAPTVTATHGVIATAGEVALRLDGGVLWETCDGWEHWARVAPPPTGEPADLAGAMCTEDGCVVGPWARLGWGCGRGSSTGPATAR